MTERHIAASPHAAHVMATRLLERYLQSASDVAVADVHGCEVVIERAETHTANTNEQPRTIQYSNTTAKAVS